MNKVLRLFLVPVLSVVASGIAQPASADILPGTYAPVGTTTAVIIPADPNNPSAATCVGINNYNPSGVAVFVPNHTLSEWQMFVHNIQSYVQIVDCPNCPAGSAWMLPNGWGGGGTQSYPPFPPGQNYTVTWGGGFHCIWSLFGICLSQAAWGPSTLTLQCLNNQVTVVSDSYGATAEGAGAHSGAAETLAISPDGKTVYDMVTGGGNGSFGTGCGGVGQSPCGDSPTSPVTTNAQTVMSVN